MLKYTDYKCPVCNQQFQENDDIVTCPECGTPHHRECYNLSGHCVNQGLHQSGYSFKGEAKKVEEPKDEPIMKMGDVSGQYYVPAEEHKTSSNEQNQNSNYSPFGNFQFNVKTEQQGEIDGISVKDIAATVSTNSQRYVSKFKMLSEKKKKTSFNWAALIFGPYYFFFRKMYKQGVAFLCLQLTTSICTLVAMMNFAPNFMSKYEELITSYSSTLSSASSSSLLNSLSTATDINMASKIGLIVSIAFIILRIIQSLFADYFYKNTVFEIIKKVDEQIDSGATFNKPTVIFGQVDDLNQDQMRQIYLRNKGGISFFMPVLAYLAVDILTSLLTNFL